MGYTEYCSTTRAIRAETLDYATADINTIFTQSRENRAHAEMSPKGVKVRECRDSETHPNAFPIIIGLDVTGSMRQIPHELVKDGLPTLMTTLIQRGIKDASLLFCAVGDHECDRFPLQIGQFESGDAELDLWLTRTFLEGGGGGNAGESYLLAHYFAAFHTSTDAFEKRGQKGILFTIGDEPGLKSLPASVIKSVMGSTQASTYSDVELLQKVQEKYHVFHIVVLHSQGAEHSLRYWKNLLGQNCLTVDSPSKVATTIAETVLNFSQNEKIPSQGPSEKTKEDSHSDEIL